MNKLWQSYILYILLKYTADVYVSFSFYLVYSQLGIVIKFNRPPASGIFSPLMDGKMTERKTLFHQRTHPLCMYITVQFSRQRTDLEANSPLSTSTKRNISVIKLQSENDNDNGIAKKCYFACGMVLLFSNSVRHFNRYRNFSVRYGQSWLSLCPALGYTNTTL